MKYLLLFLCIGLMGAGSCNDVISVESLCIIDIEAKKCWIDKESGRGFSLTEIDGFFAINETDLRKITRRLDECNAQK